MKRTSVLLIMIGLLLALIAPVAAQEAVGPATVGLFPDSPQYALHGPYWVGTREFVIGADTERPLAATMWYPAVNADLVPEEINYTYTPLIYRPVTVPGHAIADAYPDFTSGPYPLVIFTHDNYMTRFAALYLTEHLASQGFVVLSAQRTGTGTGDVLYYTPQDMENMANSWVYGPSDIQRQIDFATALTASDGALPGLVDVEHVAVVGQATGADTALAAAGARISFAVDRDWCSSVANDPALASSFDYYARCAVNVASEERLLAMRGADTQPGEVWPAFDVSGVDALVSLSVYTHFYDQGDLTNVNVPTLLVTGNMFGDDIQVNQTIYDKISTEQKAIAVFDHGSTALTEEPCDSLQKQLSYFICYQEQVWNLDRGHDLTNHFTTAFLLDTLKGDNDAAAALAPDAVSFPGIEYQAQGF